MRSLKEYERISDCDLWVYIIHLDKLREDFKIRYGDLGSMHVADWFVTPFDMKIYSKGYEHDLEDGLIEKHVDLKANALFKSKNFGEYWSNIC